MKIRGGRITRNFEFLKLFVNFEFELNSSKTLIKNFSRRRMKLEPYKQYGLIMDGMSMAIAYNHCPELLRIVGMTCDAVVCCRMSPLQKSEVRSSIKFHTFDLNINYHTINCHLKDLIIR